MQKATLSRDVSSALFSAVAGRADMVDTVVEKISKLIADNKIEAGQKLPPEAAIGEQIGVSRTVVREAMRVLVAQGLVETRHGVGTIVKSNRAGYLAAPLSSMLRMRQISIADLHGVRTILEVEIAGIAASNAQRSEIAQLAKLVAALEASAQDPGEYVKADNAFHRYLAEITHNPLLVTLLDSIGEIIAEIRKFVAQYPEIASAGVPDHRRIMECIRKHDVSAAREAMRKHLDHARQILERAATSGRVMARKRASQ